MYKEIKGDKMTLLQHLQRIMDLPNPLEEANKKLVDTYMLVNGQVKMIKEFNIYEDTAITWSPKTNISSIEKIETLEIFLPEAGLYQLDKKGFVCLTKKPLRQWHKSYRPGNYNVEPFGSGIDNSFICELVGKQKKDILVHSNGFIYYWNKIIGRVKNSSEIVCTNIHYKQELMDWIRDAN